MTEREVLAGLACPARHLPLAPYDGEAMGKCAMGFPVLHEVIED